MRIITVSNQKGGLAKSTTATSLAALFGERGRTLLIDADPQGNSTDTFRAETQGRATLFDVILDEEPLKAEEMTAFIERSQQILKILAGK